MLRLANQLAVFPGALGQYGRRAQTRSDHLKLVLKYLDWSHPRHTYVSGDFQVFLRWPMSLPSR